MIAKDFARIRMIALCVFALGALTLPASAVAAGHHDAKAHHAKKKKKKKKSGTTVIVKCASVTVTCKGKPGPAGPQGPAGNNGANGAAVVLRARSAGSVAAGEQTECHAIICLGGQNVPVSPSTWTQGPTEDDQLVSDTLTISLPSEAACGAENSKKEPTGAVAEVIVTVDGTIEGFAVGRGGTSATTVSTPIVFALGIFEVEGGGSEFGSGFFIGKGSSQTHTVAVDAIDNCPGTHASVSGVAIDVLASF